MIVIRRAQETDAGTLATLAEKTFIETFAEHNTAEDMRSYLTEAFGAEKQLKEIQDPDRWVEIAWEGAEAAGFFHLRKAQPDPSVTGAKPIELLRLYVDSRWHGKGVGAALLEKSLAIARDQGFQTIWLGVWERNFRARKFYSKFGFKEVGQHIFRLGTDDQIDLIYSSPL